MSRYYSDIAIKYFDIKALENSPAEKLSVQNDDDIDRFCGKEKNTGKRNYSCYTTV